MPLQEAEEERWELCCGRKKFIILLEKDIPGIRLCHTMPTHRSGGLCFIGVVTDR